jgi:hypothetical protein
MITQKIEKAERTPKDELDEEALVKEVKPLIEEGSKILQESNGIIRGLDPDGHVQANAKGKTQSHQASPEEYHLADVLKEVCHEPATVSVSSKILTGISSSLERLPSASTTRSARSRTCPTPRRSSTLSGASSRSLCSRSSPPWDFS